MTPFHHPSEGRGERRRPLVGRVSYNDVLRERTDLERQLRMLSSAVLVNDVSAIAAFKMLRSLNDVMATLLLPSSDERENEGPS